MLQEHIDTIKKALKNPLKESDIPILKAMLKEPLKSDRSIAKQLGIGFFKVYCVRKRYGLYCSQMLRNSLNGKLFEERARCESDNKDLERGICRINLYGDELARYLVIRAQHFNE